MTRRRSLRILIPLLVVALVGVLWWLIGLWPALPSRGGGQTEFGGARAVDPAHVLLPDGYRTEVVSEGLTFPTDVAFDEEGAIYVIEAGYSYGEVFTTPRLLRVTEDGGTEEIAAGDNGPWNGLTYADGSFYVAGGTVGGGEILRIGTDGAVEALLTGLPSYGDHHTNSPVIGPDGLLYFGQGTATNAGVVGVDNADFGWLSRNPEFHDTPCEDVTLAGASFESDDPLTEGSDRVVTGAYRPFGERGEAGQTVPGALPCNGAIMRVAPGGGELELVAWGFRNPFGLAFDAQGQLFVVENSFDERGSRPVFGTGDLLWLVEEGAWYGWPDYHGGRPLSDPRFRHPGGAPGLLLADHPGTPPEPVALLAVHSSSNGMEFSTSPAFGYEGEAFIAQFGDMAPGVGKVVAPVGFRVVRVDVETGVVEDFAVNVEPNAPASWGGNSGLERPISVAFGPGGAELYIVDFGVMTVTEMGPVPVEGTGVLWRVVREGAP